MERFTVCGCYEVPALLASCTFNACPHSLHLQIWCPIRWDTLSHPDDIYGRGPSGVDGSMAVRNTCYSARAVFGCYQSGNWKDNCGYQQEGRRNRPGAGTASGRFVKLWEQLVL